MGLPLYFAWLSGAPRAQPIKHQRDDEVGHLSCGDVVGTQPPSA
jgi:hypothetical protein